MVLAIHGSALPAESAVRPVTNGKNSLAGSLRQAIQDASPGDTIVFQIPTTDPGYDTATGTYTITLTTAELLINKDLKIEGGTRKIVVARSSAEGTPDFRIFNVASGNVTIANLTITGGREFSGGGGGVLNSGNLTLRGCTFFGNIAGSFPGGGAIHNAAGGTVRVINSTFHQNHYAAIENAANGTIVMHNSTVSGNGGPAAAAGGIYNASGGTFSVGSSILAGNDGSYTDATGNFTSLGYNFVGISDQSTGFTSKGDQIGTSADPADPQLGGLQDNGGPTPTMAPSEDSLVVDQGNRGTNASGQPINADQRGAQRPIDQRGIANAIDGDGSDIGAFERPPAVRLANISTRLRIEAGDNVLIGGFIITGLGKKRIIIRALGPSLPVSGRLANPKVEIFNAAGDSLAVNDNWKDAPNREEIEDTTIPPPNNLEAALLGKLPSGAYTVKVSSATGGTGVGSVEVYDLDDTNDVRLVNISTRGVVGTGDNVMIGGFILVGTQPEKVIVRAIGPSLPVNGALQNPVLELRDQNGALVRRNNDWRSDQQKEIKATGIPPENERESAIVALLPPAAYTAVVRGVNGTTGVALVEAYALE